MVCLHSQCPMSMLHVQHGVAKQDEIGLVPAWMTSSGGRSENDSSLATKDAEAPKTTQQLAACSAPFMSLP